jgi:hypothetical protein
MSDELPAGDGAAAAALTVPLNADGTIAALPDALQKHLDGIVSRRLAEDRSRRSKTPDPVESERLKTLEQEVEGYRLRDAEAQRKYEDAIAIREERERKERDRYQAEIDRRTQRIQRSVRAEIQAEALRAGARDESLDELAEILGGKVALNDDLDPVVAGADGQPDPGGIAGLVSRYLEAKPHHRRAPAGQTMGAAGGAFARTGQSTGSAADRIAAIQARIAQQGGATGADLRDLREAKSAS